MQRNTVLPFGHYNGTSIQSIEKCALGTFRPLILDDDSGFPLGPLLTTNTVIPRALR